MHETWRILVQELYVPYITSFFSFQIYSSLVDFHPHMKVYNKEDIPERNIVSTLSITISERFSIRTSTLSKGTSVCYMLLKLMPIDTFQYNTLNKTAPVIDTKMF